MIRAAIVGVGRWGQTLVDSVQTDGKPKGSNIHFTHAVTTRVDALAHYLKQQNLKPEAEYEQILTNPDIDAVVLTTPHSLHHVQIIAAASAGKHVFVEKPLALSRNDAEAAVRACHEARVFLAVGHNRRFLPAISEIKELIDAGSLGTILHAEGNFSGSFGLAYRPGVWRASRSESPAGGMTAMGIHIVDTLIYLCGNIQGVRAQSINQAVPCEIDDTTSVLIKFTDGKTGYVGTLMATAKLWHLRVLGTKGWVQMRGHENLDICYLDNQITERRFAPADIERAELEMFAAAANGGEQGPLSLNDALHGISVLDAVVKSAALDGEYVAISETKR